jgi:hypothetical protein
MWQSLAEMYQIFCSEFVFQCLIILHITLIPSEVLLVLPVGYYEMRFFLFYLPVPLQSVRRHSAIVLTVTIKGM